MQESCAAFLARWTWRDGAVRCMPEEKLRDLMTESYIAGYTERHERDRKPQTSQS